MVVAVLHDIFIALFALAVTGEDEKQLSDSSSRGHVDLLVISILVVVKIPILSISYIHKNAINSIILSCIGEEWMSIIIVGRWQFPNINRIRGVPIPKGMNTLWRLYQLISHSIIKSNNITSLWFLISISDKLHENVISKLIENQVLKTKYFLPLHLLTLYFYYGTFSSIFQVD